MRKILVVDDDDRLRALLAEYLGERGFAVEAVADGEHDIEHDQIEVIGLHPLEARLPVRDRLYREPPFAEVFGQERP